MYNKKVVELEEKIINTITESGLHIATVRLILDKVLRMVNDTLELELNKEEEITNKNE